MSGDVLFNGKTTFKSSVTGAPTHFPFTDGKNYIRGDTQIDGITTFAKPIVGNINGVTLSPNGQYYLVLQDNGSCT
jgi:hypothetical protein